MNHPRFWSRLALLALALALLVALSHTLDPWAYAASARYRAGLDKPVTLYDWYQLLRQLGSALPWALISLLLLLVATTPTATPTPPPIPLRNLGTTPASPALRLAMLIPASVLAAGVAAELLKPLIGRTRPEDAIKPAGSELVYAFMPWSQRLGDWSDLGIPSSHGAVSFAAACAIATLYPRTLIVTVPLAIGTCFTRVVNDNHYLSDTLAGAAIGALCALACARLLPPRGANRP